MKNLLTLSEITSKALPISTLRRLAKEDNNFPAFKVGRKYVIYEEDYIAYLDKQKGSVNSLLIEPSPSITVKEKLYE